MTSQLPSYPRHSALKSRIGLSTRRNYSLSSTLYENGNTTCRLRSHSPSSQTTVLYQPSRARQRSHRSKHVGSTTWTNSTAPLCTDQAQRTRLQMPSPGETSLESPPLTTNLG